MSACETNGGWLSPLLGWQRIIFIRLALLRRDWRSRSVWHKNGPEVFVVVWLGQMQLGLGKPKPACPIGALEEAKPLAEWLSSTLAMPTLAQTLTTAGGYTVTGGFACVFLFSSPRPLVSSKPMDYVWRILEGLQGLTSVSKAFGDVLSYLRLFALGLASAQLAVTFNNLAHGMMDIPGLGILLALLILLAGHSINLMLGIMGGVVHGLRLNCIEFFNWCLTEEGYPFRAFCKKAGS